MQDYAKKTVSLLTAYSALYSLRRLLLVNCLVLSLVSSFPAFSEGIWPKSLDGIESNIEQAKLDKKPLVWAKQLIRATEKRYESYGHLDSINYILYAEQPSEAASKALLNLYAARKIRFYLRELDSPSSDDIGDHPADKRLSLRNRRALLESVDELYREAFALSKKSAIKLSDLTAILELNGSPEKSREQLFDYVVNDWISHLVDDHFWASSFRGDENLPPIASLLPNSEAAVSGGLPTLINDSNPGKPGSSLPRHPLNKLNQLRLNAEKHYLASNRSGALFETSRVYLQQLSTFYTDSNSILRFDGALASELSNKAKLDPETLAMGLYQRGRFNECLEHQLTTQARKFYEKAIEISPGSVGADLARQRLFSNDQPSLSIRARRQTAAGDVLAEVRHKNIDRLYIKAWRVQDESQQVLQQKLVSVSPDHEWQQALTRTLNPGLVNPGLDRVILNSKLGGDGLWLIGISSEKDFNARTALSYSVLVRQSKLVTSVIQSGEELSVAAYNSENGRPVNDFTATISGEVLGSPERPQAFSSGKDGLALLAAKPDSAGSLKIRSEGANQQLDISTSPNSSQEGRYNDTGKAVVFTNQQRYGAGELIRWTVLAGSHASISGVAAALRPVSLVKNITTQIKLSDASGALLETIPVMIGKDGLARGNFSAADYPDAVQGRWLLESDISEKHSFWVGKRVDGLVRASAEPGRNASSQTVGARMDFVMDFPKQMHVGELASFKAGVTDSKQASRLYIYNKRKLVDTVSISAGVKDLSFLPTSNHEGGLSFELEWVKDHRLYNERVFVEVPWSSQELGITLKTVKAGDDGVWRLLASEEGSQGLSKAQVLVDWYNTRQAGDVDRVNFSALYPQYPVTRKRMSGNGWQQGTPLFDTPRPYANGQISLPKFKDGHYKIEPGKQVFVITLNAEDGDQMAERAAARYGLKRKPKQLQSSVRDDDLRQQLYKVSEGQQFIDLKPPATMKHIGAVRVIVITPEMKIGQLLVVLR